jgi:acetyl esterase
MYPANIRSDARAFLDFVNASPMARLENLSADQARTLMSQMRAAAPAVSHNLAIVRDLEFDNAGSPIRLRFYDLLAHREAGPILVYFHGGGFVLGDLESHHALCVSMASTLSLPLVSVDYRLAPEHPWPAAPQDAEAAARWVAAHALNTLGRGVTSLVLAGDSAGANLAAVTSRALRDAPAEVAVAAQFLMYPCTSTNKETGSRTLFADGLFLTKGAMDWFFSQYAARDGDPRIDLHAFDQAGMPPTVLVTAGLDPLRDEGRDYAAALIQAGVPVIYQEAKGNIHGSFSMTAAIPSTKADLNQALEALKLLIGSNR